MAIYKSDIVDINLESGSIHRSFMKHSIGTADQAADRFGIRAFRNGEAVDLSGASCYGYFRDPQGNNIALTSNGTVDGNVAYVTLPQACYNYEGNFTLTIKLLVTGVTSTVRIIDGVVDNTNTGSAVAPTSAVPTYSEILSQYDDMVAATAVANGAIATTFNAATVYPAGSYVINSGALYRITADHAANVTWANTSKVATNFGAEVSSLKSAITSIESDLVPKTKTGWESGWFSHTDGSNATSGNYIRNQTFVGLDSGVNKIECESGFLFALFAWDLSGNYIGSYKTSGVFNTETTNTKTVEEFDCGAFPNYKFKIAMRMNPPSTSITTANGSKCHFYYPTDKTLTLENKAADAAAVKKMSDFGFIWGDGYIGSNGTYVNDSTRKLTNYIPIGTIQSIHTSIPLNINIFNKSKTHLMLKSYTADSDIILPSVVGDEFGYVRIWYNTTYSSDIASELKITYGEPLFPRCGYGFINSSTGKISVNKDYVVTDLIPIGLVESITCDVSLNCELYKTDKTYIKKVTLNTGKAIIPQDDSYGYFRLWKTSTDIKTLMGSIAFKFGAKELVEVAVPAKEYMLSGVEYDLFYYNLVNPKGKTICRIESETVANGNSILFNTDKACFIENPQSIPSSKMYVRLFDGKNRAAYKSQEVSVIVSNKTTDTGDIYVQVIGDSFTDMSPSWIDHILAENLCPSIHFVGICKNKEYSGQYHEGRGGWTIKMYAQPARGTGLDGSVYAGFWQPNDDYKYWGDKRFWANVNSGAAALSDFDGSKFGSDGYLLNPTTDDIMYDGSKYVKWNGSAWAEVASTDYTWGFDYSKYLSMWSIHAPSICAVMLGMNDFREAIFNDTEWGSFRSRLDALATSYFDAVPTGKFVAVIHCTDTGRDWNIENAMRMTADYQNYSLWQYRQKMVEYYDGKEEDGIYLCDAGIMVDGEYGYETVEKKPFSTYSGTERIKLQTGNPHPVYSYPAMSLPFAALIQYLRSL